MNNHLNWALVDKVGTELGATESARMKWRQRKVPAEWRIKIAQELMKREIAVSLSDFDRLERNPGRLVA